MVVFPILFFGFSLVSEAQEFQFLSMDGDTLSVPASVEDRIANQPESAKNILTTYFADQGFLRVRIKEIGSIFYVVQGEPFEANLAIREGDLVVSDISEIRYTKQSIEDLIESTLDTYIQDGYYFAEGTITSFNIDTLKNSVAIEVDLKPGEQVMLQGLIVNGNRLNSDQYLSKISGVSSSSIATSKTLQRIRVQLLQSELFEEVSFPQVQLVDNEYYAVVDVQELRLNQLDGVLGYVPDANGNGQIVGDVKLNLWSVFAEGNGIDLVYRRIEPEVSRLNAKVKQYWIGSLPVGVEAGIRLFQNDTTYQHREFNLSGFYQTSPQLKVITGISVEGTTGSTGNRIEPGGNRRTASLGFELSTLNRLEVPTSGIKASVIFGVSEKSVEIDSIRSFSQQHLTAQIAGYISLSEQSVLAVRSESFVLNGSTFTDSDLFRFGGAASLRGFSEEQFTASLLSWADIEYRFMTNPNSYLFSFVTAGRYDRPKLLTETTHQFKQSEWLQSFGFGLSYKVRVGRLSFSYAISPQSGLGNGKVHVAITTRL